MIEIQPGLSDFIRLSFISEVLQILSSFRFLELECSVTQKSAKSAILSQLAMIATSVILAGIMILLSSSTQLDSGVIIAIAFVVAAPLIIMATRLDPENQKGEKVSVPFWPSRSDLKSFFWGIVALITMFACITTPILVFGVIIYFLRSGDSWGMVIIRILFVVIAFCIWKFWVEFASAKVPNFFRGRLSDKTIDEFMHEEPIEEPKSALLAARKNWKLLATAIVAICIATGVINLNSRMLDIKVGRNRAQAFLKVLLWCRGNPNTVRSSSILLAIVSLAIYALRIRRANLARHEKQPDAGTA